MSEKITLTDNQKLILDRFNLFEDRSILIFLSAVINKIESNKFCRLASKMSAASTINNL